MRKIKDLAKDEQSMETLVKLTSAFEGIASMRIAQIKKSVLQSTDFFNELYAIYSQLRVNNNFNFGRDRNDENIINKELYIVITAEGGFSGDIDQKLVEYMLKTFDKNKNEIIVIGHHGAIQLSQRGVVYKKYYKLPASDTNINVGPLIREVRQYEKTKIFYQEYKSLLSQEVKSIELIKAVREVGGGAESDDVISEVNYIFEPSSYDVASHLERSMMQIAIGQLILSSKLAQYASRFRAMTGAHRKAYDNSLDLHVEYNRAKRRARDERLKKVIISVNRYRATR